MLPKDLNNDEKLINANAPPAIFTKPKQFKGCGGNTVWDLNEIQFRKPDWAPDQWLCLDRIALV